MTMPTNIQLLKKTGLLELSWHNGESIKITGNQLRQYCACSSCRARNIVGTMLVTESPVVEKVALMGSVGLQIGFADGHDRGVFPWAYLRAIHDGRAAEHLRDQ